MQGTVGPAGVVRPGGDNVTTQQIMETMCALQAEVATSRVEIAASRANNAELHRANENLGRDLEEVGERATGERAPLLPHRARSMPFSHAIMDIALLMEMCLHCFGICC